MPLSVVHRLMLMHKLNIFVANCNTTNSTHTQANESTQSRSQPIHHPHPPPIINTPHTRTSNDQLQIPPSTHAVSTVNTDINEIIPQRHSRRIAAAASVRDERLQSIRRVIDDDKLRRSNVGLDVGDDVPVVTAGDDTPTFEKLNEDYIPPLDKLHPTPDFIYEGNKTRTKELYLMHNTTINWVGGTFGNWGNG